MSSRFASSARSGNPGFPPVMYSYQGSVFALKCLTDNGTRGYPTSVQSLVRGTRSIRSRSSSASVRAHRWMAWNGLAGRKSVQPASKCLCGTSHAPPSAWPSATIEAAKEHPVAAAGIAAAAVAGATYGARKLHGHDENGDGSDKG